MANPATDQKHEQPGPTLQPPPASRSSGPRAAPAAPPSPDIEALLQQEMDQRLDDEEQARLEAEEEARAEEERVGLARPLITATRWPRQPTLAFFGSGWLLKHHPRGDRGLKTRPTQRSGPGILENRR